MILNHGVYLLVSWMVLRSQEKEQEVIVVTVDKPVAKLMEDKWCDDEDDWSSLSRWTAF